MLGTYHLNVLFEILKNLHFLYNTEKIYLYLLENLLKAIDCEAASLYITDNKRENLILKACIGPKSKVMTIIAEELPFPIGKGICGWVAKFNQGIIVDDVQKDQRFNSQVDMLTGYKTKSVLCAPLSKQDEVMGVIEILNKKSSAFNKNDLDLVDLIARQTAIALENARLYLELTKSKNFSESILANLTGGFIAIDSNEIVTHLNPVAEKILGLSVQEVVSKTCAESLKLYPAIQSALIKTLKSRESVFRQETYCQKQNQDQMLLGYSTFLIQDSQSANKPLGAGIIFQDISKYTS